MQQSYKDLYLYCLNDKKIYFETLKNAKVYDRKSVKKNPSSNGIIEALKFRYTLKYLGSQYENITVPCIPGQQHILNQQPTLSQNNNFPCLIKVPYKTENIGYASGKRSLIVFKDNKIIRYKGCGNLLEGFTILNNQPRGCHYCHTAKRQFYLTQYINKILWEQLHLSFGNQPLFIYQFNQVEKYGLRNQLKFIEKYCCVFQTIGDRRAGTHLISPLEILYLNLCSIKLINWQEKFKQKKRWDQVGLIQYLFDFQLTVNPKQTFLQKYDLRPQNKDSYLDLLIQQIKLLNSQDYQQKIKILAKKFIQNEQDTFINLLINIKNFFNIAIIICAKIGWEMGRIKRIFCQKGVNWGFFSDHGGTTHCNAHLNNFLVTLPQKSQKFLRCIDFDIAFTKQQFINIQIGSQKYGMNDLDAFEQLLQGEYQAMEISLSGIEVMNFKYGIEEDSQIKQQTLMARVAFRDTLIRNFRAGMKNELETSKKIQELWDQNIQDIKKCVLGCLLISKNFET